MNKSSQSSFSTDVFLLKQLYSLFVMLCEYLMPILCQQGVTSWSRRRAPGSQTGPLLSKSNQQTDLISQKSFASLLHSIGLKVYPCICQKMYQSISIQWCFNIALSAWRQQLREHPFLLQQVQRGRGFWFFWGFNCPARSEERTQPLSRPSVWS